MSESEIARARERAAAQAWTPARVLADPTALRGQLHDRAFLDMCRAVKDDLVPELLTLVQNRRDYARLNASALLAELGDVRATDGFIAILESDDEHLRISALALLGVIGLRPRKIGVRFEAAVAIDHARLHRVIRSRYEQDPTTHEGRLALQVALRLDAPDVRASIVPLVGHPDDEVRAMIVSWLADRGEDDGALDALAAFVDDGDDTEHSFYLVIRALERFAAEPRFALRAAEIAARYVRAGCESEHAIDNSVANHVWNATRAILTAKPPFEREILSRLLHAAVVPGWVRADVLPRLSELGGGRAFLEPLLGDSDLRQGAADALAKLRDRDAVPALARAIDAELDERNPRRKTTRSLVDALVVCDASLEPAIDRAARLLGRWDLTRIVWLREGITPARVAAKLDEAGISHPAADDVAQLEQQWQNDPSAMSIFVSLLGENGVTWFDTEAPVVPPDYVELIGDLARTSRGAIALECASQEPPAGMLDMMTQPEHIAIEVVVAERIARFQAEFRGDWIDVPAVLAALDAAASDAGRSERFFALHTGDQTCIVTCADGAAFRRVARELRVPIEEDADAAMRCGIAFEQRVLAP
jgi:HEAT repeat protein